MPEKFSHEMDLPSPGGHSPICRGPPPLSWSWPSSPLLACALEATTAGGTNLIPAPSAGPAEGQDTLN